MLRSQAGDLLLLSAQSTYPQPEHHCHFLPSLRHIYFRARTKGEQAWNGLVKLARHQFLHFTNCRVLRECESSAEQHSLLPCLR